jgi:hypothetical protein
MLRCKFFFRLIFFPFCFTCCFYDIPSRHRFLFGFCC